AAMYVWISPGVPGTVSSTMLMRSARPARRCAADRPISRRLSSGPPVWRMLATRHDSRRSLLVKTSAVPGCAPSCCANFAPATHTSCDDGVASLRLLAAAEEERSEPLTIPSGFNPATTALTDFPDCGTETLMIR